MGVPKKARVVRLASELRAKVVQEGEDTVYILVDLNDIVRLIEKRLRIRVRECESSVKIVDDRLVVEVRRVWRVKTK